MAYLRQDSRPAWNRCGRTEDPREWAGQEVSLIVSPETTIKVHCNMSPPETELDRPAGGGQRSSRALLDLEQFLPYRLSVLSNRVSGNIAKVYGDRYGLVIPEWRVMTVLALYPGSSASEVSDRTAMDKVAVSRAVARLLERNFIKREMHGDDRRRSVLALSESGFEAYEIIAPMVIDCERRLLAPLTEDERSTLDRLIDKLADVGLESMQGG